MMYLKKIKCKNGNIMYMLVVYNPSDVAQMEKVFINEALANSLIDKYSLEVK